MKTKINETSTSTNSPGPKGYNAYYPVGTWENRQKKLDKVFKNTTGYRMVDFLTECNSLNLTDLLEGVIGKLVQQVKVPIEVADTYHGRDRSTGRDISDRDIVDTIKKAAPRIVMRMLTNKVKLEDELAIQDTSNDLNIIGRMSTTPARELEFVIITTMRKRNFKVNPGTKIVTVR